MFFTGLLSEVRPPRRIQFDIHSWMPFFTYCESCDDHVAALLERSKRLDHRHQLHAVVRGFALAAEQLLSWLP